MLQQMYPSWFERPHGQFPRWYPDNVAFRFVDTCIAELTFRGETGDTPSDTVEAMLLGLVDYLDADDARLACARRVSHLMTDNRQELTVAGVTILPYQQFQEIRQITESIPTAPSAFNGERPHSFPPPEATLVSDATRGPSRRKNATLMRTNRSVEMSAAIRARRLRPGVPTSTPADATRVSGA